MTLSLKLDAVIAEHRLLSHPFYKAWTEGRLSKEVLRRYAGQYFAQVSAFPRFVSTVHSRCPEISARKVLLENLVDEELHGTDHPELWLQFAEGLGATRDEVRAQAPLPETKAMVDAFFQLAEGDWRDGLCALYAYESQQPEVSRQKADGLRRYYGVSSPTALAYFEVHAETDIQHRNGERCALAGCLASGASPDVILDSATEALDAYWGLLDGICEEAEIPMAC